MSKTFEQRKKEMLEENERKYGSEVREKYGDKTVQDSNSKFMNMSEQEYDRMNSLAQEILDALALAVRQRMDPAAQEGARIADLHRQWITACWPAYSEEAHKGLVQMYLDDDRFTQYYDAAQHGCAQFLRDAVFALLA